MNTLRRLWQALSNERFWGYGLFWSWNIIFLAFMFFGFAPYLLPDLLTWVQAGWTPATYLVLAVVITLLPVGAIALGFTLLRHAPGKLLALGYGVEGPLMVLLLIRFFLIRQATAAVTLLLVVGVVGIATLLWQLVDTRIEKRHPFWGYVRAVGLALLLMGGIYAGVWVAFYAIPLAASLPGALRDLGCHLWELITHADWRALAMLSFSFLWAILVTYTATLVIVMPIAVPLIYIHQWWRGFKGVAASQGWRWPAAATGIVVVAATVAFVVANQQPQHKAFALLKDPPQSIDQAKSLLEQQDTLRAGLLNAYLSPTRYLSAVGEVGHVQSLYEYALKLSAENARRVEALYEVVARPLLYEPMNPVILDQHTSNWWLQQALLRDPQEAAALYQQFFDTPINKGEREALVQAARSNWSGQQALQDWQTVDEHEVYLKRQEVTVTEHGDWAEVELYEVYQNITTQRQEVVYYFSLPESAVITGLWLGNGPNRSQRYAFQVAPRGAAQQVYREQIRLNIDPALLEQVGPRQYRLRAFPVEPGHWEANGGRSSTLLPGPADLHLWMTYRVLAEGDAWPLPSLADHRNVYWDKNTVRSINGQDMGVAVSDWLPPSVVASSPIQRQAHQVTFPDGETVILLPLSSSRVPALPQDIRLAVVLDRSFSMSKHSEQALQAMVVLTGISPEADVYLTASTYRGEPPSRAKLADIAPENLLFYGGQNAAELLAQFAALSAGRRYDAIFVITDDSGFQLGGENIPVNIPDAPVWMIHLNGAFPLGYDDATLQAIQASGGGVVGSLEEAFDRLAISLADGRPSASTPTRDALDGYEWITIPPDGQMNEATAAVVDQAKPVIHNPNEPFAALAARRAILDTLYRWRGQITQLDTLDALHAIAAEQGIVTPYSSMIVLINQTQQNRLEKLEGQADRFQREGEQIGETQPLSPFQVTGVPEPHEWLLIGLAVAMLAGYVVKNRKLALRRF